MGCCLHKLLIGIASAAVIPVILLASLAWVFRLLLPIAALVLIIHLANR